MGILKSNQNRVIKPITEVAPKDMTAAEEFIWELGKRLYNVMPEVFNMPEHELNKIPKRKFVKLGGVIIQDLTVGTDRFNMGGIPFEKAIKEFNRLKKKADATTGNNK